ncbi:NUDIX domain-containing protein [Prosthecobacter sp. SYSU 5D2]|uniref:NUDIX domain-containing protein n=1 Tax=Prosthecobacter sp. SYSU 5D2 TaxID=3134134 RepID=UPI0031FE52DC
MSPYYQALRQAVGHRLLLMPAVAAVIHDENGHLLLQEKHDGSWSLPAGAIEPGETPQEAVAREVLEETGLRSTSSEVITTLGGVEFRHTYANGDEVEYVIVLFRCRVVPCSDVLDTEETRSLRYFSRVDMPALELPYDLDLLFSGG